MCVVYGLNYLDKTALSYASVMGIQQDIGLRGNDYEWLSSMFYFGYLAWEYPTNRLLQRVPLAKYSGTCIVLWGCVLACFAAVENYSGAIAVRFMLGVCEAAVSPGFALFTSQWYTKAEQGTRTGIWFSFNGFVSQLSIAIIRDRVVTAITDPHMPHLGADIGWITRLRHSCWHRATPCRYR